MSRLSASTVIRASQDTVFEVITDPTRAASLFPGVEVEHVTLPLKRGSVFNWHFVFLGMRLRGTWTVDELIAPSAYIATTAGVPSRWTFSLTGEGTETRLVLEVEYEAPSSVLKAFALSIIEPHMHQHVETYLQGLKHLIELGRNQPRT